MEPKKGSFICYCFPSAILLTAVFFIGSVFLLTYYQQSFSGCNIYSANTIKPKTCENECRVDGSEALPRGIVSRTTDLEMRPLWGPPRNKKSKSPLNLLAIAVGIKQKQNVNNIVKKFPLTDFAIMLFHYDGDVNGWRDSKWSNDVVHISAINQTKWWFAKRFLHPDVIAQYAYIFLWDEELGVENFNVERRSINLHGPGTRCYEGSTEPPCTGFVEMMAPVFSRASWRCAWYMIQNDLVHAWGLDFQLGYCAQGNRTANIGIVDSEYLIHLSLPTLGGSGADKTNNEVEKQSSADKILAKTGQMTMSALEQSDGRDAVRKEPYIELENFKNRWKKAVREDECWNDPFHQN